MQLGLAIQIQSLTLAQKVCQPLSHLCDSSIFILTARKIEGGMQGLKKLCDPSTHIFSRFLELLIPRSIHSNILLCQLESDSHFIHICTQYVCSLTFPIRRKSQTSTIRVRTMAPAATFSPEKDIKPKLIPFCPLMCPQAMLIIGFHFSIGKRTFCCVLLAKKAMFMLQELNMKI